MPDKEEKQASRGWAESVVLPVIPAAGGSRPPSGTWSRPASGQVQKQSEATSRQSSAGVTHTRSTPRSADESTTTLPNILLTSRKQQEQKVKATGDAECGHDAREMKHFEQNLDKFINGGTGSEATEGEGRGRTQTRDTSHGRSSSETAAHPSKNSARGENSRKKGTVETSVLAAVYGVSPYLQELKLPKKKLQPQVEPGIDEGKGPRPEAVHRKKYIKMLRLMEEEARRVKEEGEKKLLQQHQAAAKLRCKLGIADVAPRLYEAPKRVADANEEEACTRSQRKGGAGEEEADETEDDPEKAAVRKAKAKEALRVNKEIVERQQRMLAQMAEKRKEEEELEEEKRRKEAKIREKLRKAAMEAAERAREEGEGDGADGGGGVRGRRKDAEEESGPASPKRGDIEKMIQSRTRRHQERFGSEAEEEAWLRKKYGLEEGDKLFNIAGTATSYDGVRQALLARGWKEHREEDSMIFDLKWTIKTSDIAFKALNKEQLVNHFARNGNLTTKVGLTRNLRNLKWFEDVDMDEFFPRSYDLADADELYDYIEDFKMSAAEIVLKLFLRDGAGMSDCQGREVGKDNYATSVQLALLVLNAHVRRCKVIDIDDDESSDLRLSHTEWTLLLGEPCPALARDRKDLPIINEASAESGGAVPAQFGTHWNQAALVKRQRTVGYSPHGSFPQGKGLCPSKCQLTQEEYDAAFVEVCRTRKFKDKSDAELRDKAQAMLDELKEMNTQSSLLGYDNVWIVKPAGKSRGRDIVCIRSINRLLEYIGYGVAGKEMHWVVQKYMERPYLINNRKFDFRQWVMVTDWNPLTVWFYDECYLRFSMSDFSLLNLEDNLTHLCNNSIQKDHANFEAVKDASMWDLASFREHLIANHDNGEELWTGKILPQMQNISKWALMCAQDMLENRKFSSEVYGYDFMLDQDLNIWLLEVNASPDMSASTHVTERLTARVMEDMIKVMVDAREFCWGRKKNDKTCEMPTGGWELVHRGEAEVSFPISAFGCKLALTGSEIQIPKVYVGSVPSYSKLGSKRETRADKLRDEQKKKEEERMKEEERKKEQRKAQIKAEIKAKKKEERRRQREAERQERQRVAAGGSDEGDEGETLGLDGEVLAGWGEDGAGMMMTGSGSAAAQSSEGVVNHAGCENRSVERKEGREGKTPLQQSRATNWALRASEKVREDVVKREKTNPRNASQRQPQPVNKQVLACTVVSFGDVFGS